jgi:transposase-like protein
MDDYPRNLMEFDRRFLDEKACRDYLFRLRWPGGFSCPRCGHRRAWAIGDLLYECASCNYQISVTTGTLFQDTHRPLTMWFKAIWWLTSQKSGTSALGLQHVLGLGSYRTAWVWLHKLRRAMVRADRDQLNGRIEIDETYYGRVARGLGGRGEWTKALIVIAAEERGTGIGRIRMQQVRFASAEYLMPFILDSVKPGSVIHTDGWSGYSDLKKQGFQHEVTPLGNNPELASKLLPRVHLVASLLKRWLMGIHQGAVSHAHLDFYLDEFTFRFNRRRSRHRGLVFHRLMQQAVVVSPKPYREIVRSKFANLF